MRVWLSLVVVLASSLAFAESRTRLVIGSESEPVRAAFTDEMIAKLDACWTKAARTKAKITFVDGTATRVVLSKNGDAKAAKCLTAVLKTLALADAPARMVATVALDATPEPPPKLFTDKNRKTIDDVIDKNITGLDKFTAVNGNKPGGTGAGVGVAKDAPKVVVGPNDTILGALTPDEINRGVKARAGVFRACYQKELSRNANVRDGKVIIELTVDEYGVVQSTHLVSSTINAPDVDKCIRANVMRLTFPKASAPTTVTYPFLFTRA